VRGFSYGSASTGPTGIILAWPGMAIMWEVGVTKEGAVSEQLWGFDSVLVEFVARR